MAGQPKARAREMAQAVRVERAASPMQPRTGPAYLDADLMARICADLEAGVSLEVAGLCHGLGRTTLAKWAGLADDTLERAADEAGLDEAMTERVRAGADVLRAHATASADLERRLQAGELWALEILARRHRKTWGRQDTLTVDGSSGVSEVAGLLDRIAAVKADSESDPAP